MSRLECHSPLLDPIEVLLRRIGRKMQHALPPSSLVVEGGEPNLRPGLEPRELCAGRWPEGVTSRAVDRRHSKLGDFLARMAHLEGAAVIAFERLALELTAHRAPQELVQRALAARDDEIRHEARVAALARAHQGEPVRVTTDPFTARSLYEMARENAVEGCIRETYGALLGAHQATRARDLELRLAMRAIAPDEARHAALSHAVHSWALTRLNADERDGVRRAQVEAIFALARECALPVDAELVELAGLPDSGASCALLGELTRELWSPRSQHAA
jgi:hypothetical protein